MGYPGISSAFTVLKFGGRLIVVEGANLLPIGFLQPFLVLIQVLVYGPAAVLGPRKHRNLDEEIARSRGTARSEKSILLSDYDTGTGIITDILSNAWFGAQPPLGSLYHHW